LLSSISGGKLRNAHLLFVHLQNRQKYFGSAKERISFFSSSVFPDFCPELKQEQECK
jgi:hypothetical protein